jgi:hypothetical protein
MIMAEKGMTIMWIKERWQCKRMWLVIINFNVHWSSISNGKSFKEHIMVHTFPEEDLDKMTIVQFHLLSPTIGLACTSCDMNLKPCTIDNVYNSHHRSNTWNGKEMTKLWKEKKLNNWKSKVA